MVLNLVIKDDIACWSINHNIISLITYYLVSLQAFASQGEQVCTCLGAKLYGNRVWTHSVPSTWCTLTHSLLFFVMSIMPELPLMDLLILVTSYRHVSSWVIWHDAPESPIQVFFMNKKNVSPSMVHIIPASKGCFTSSMNQTFFFIFSFLFSFVSEHYQPVPCYLAVSFQKIFTFHILCQPKCNFTNRGLLLINKSKSLYESLFHSPNFTIFCPGLYCPPVHFHTNPE